MEQTPLISICIPAYKRTDMLRRLLESIREQTFRDFEVIVTDDSPDTSVRDICEAYKDLPLKYYHNHPSLGTPENWNEAIRHSSGKWIKIMHDDDWFAGPESLEAFSTAAKTHPQFLFIFSAYNNRENGNSSISMPVGFYKLRRLAKFPATLFARNIVGPPSCVLFRKVDEQSFDKRLKWLVDLDFYIRCLTAGRPYHIPHPLINIGVGDTQVTRECLGNPEVEIPESFLLLEKYGTRLLRNWRFFDRWWRLIRNLRIRSEKDIRDAGYSGTIPGEIEAMIRWQRKFPTRLLHMGLFSKLLMSVCFIVNGNREQAPILPTY